MKNTRINKLHAVPLETGKIKGSYTILFDANCQLCNSVVQFVIKRDKKKIFQFIPLGMAGELISKMPQYNNIAELDSLVLLKNEKIFTKSEAAMQVAKDLSGVWPLLYVFKLVPRYFRDKLYDVVARNRYKWFGACTVCESGQTV